MTKDEARQKLKKMGYQVVEDSSVVQVRIPMNTSVLMTTEKIRKILAEAGYEASFGVRQVKNEKELEHLLNDDADSNTQAEDEEEEPVLSEEDEESNEGTQFSLEDYGIHF